VIDRGPWPTHAGKVLLLISLTLVLVALALPGLLGRLPAAATEQTSVPTVQPQLRPTALGVGRSITTPPAAGTVVSEDHFWLQRPISSEGNDWPDSYYPYASRGDGTMAVHHGVEFVNPSGTPVLVTADGNVVVAGDDERQVYGARTGFYGKVVIEQLDQMLGGRPVYVVYGHLSEIYVRVGQRLRSGETLGAVGMTGSALGPHLHLEVRYGSNDYEAAVNPELWLRPSDGHGTLAGALLTATDEPVPDVLVSIYRAEQLTRVVRTISSYPQRGMRSDPAWQENFAAGNLQAGDWLVLAYHNGRSVQSMVTVRPGETTYLVLRF
jgi:hypothetical protein